jgi:hypothetical protein
MADASSSPQWFFSGETLELVRRAERCHAERCRLINALRQNSLMSRKLFTAGCTVEEGAADCWIDVEHWNPDRVAPK